MSQMTAPWLLLAAGAVLALALGQLAKRRDGDAGGYWQRVVAWSLLPLAGWLLLAWIAPEFNRAWQVSGWSPPLPGNAPGAAGETQYWLALGLPFAVWLAALLAGLALKPATPAPSRWLAGGVGFGNSRLWVLGCALPLLLIVALKAYDLGVGPSAYPAALWSLLAVAALSLIGIASSASADLAGEALAEPKAGTEGIGSGEEPWPQWLAAAGIQSQPLAAWPASEPPRAVRGADAEAVMERLRAIGAVAVAPELAEGLAALLKREPAGDEYGALRLVFAPDACGQAEIVSLAASLLDQQFHTISLVVVPRGADLLAAQLRRWLPDAAGRVVALGHGGSAENALAWVADAEFLSDRLLPQLKNPGLAQRIGLVVWWRLDDYSGAMAANLWAVTRRLHRLLRVHGRHDLRTLALLRTAAADAQQAEFVRRLLPHASPPATHTHIAPRRAKPVALHLLQAQASPLEQQYLLLRAASASVAGRWPTHIAVPGFVSAAEFAQFAQTVVGGQAIGGQLCADLAQAGASLMRVGAADVLALPAIASQSGRANGGLATHHLGLMLPDNPYVAHLLKGLAQSGGFPVSRRLVCAASCPAIIRRHLLLALNELPDTRLGLLQNAHWDEAAVAEMLRSLSNSGQLAQKEVRFLDDRDRLVSEFEYQSRKIPSGGYAPLDTVGLQLLEVRERAGGGEEGGVRLRIDPERLLIKAYPGRVFMCHGERYRIRLWDSLEAAERGGVDCVREGQCWATWRIHTANVFGIRPLPGKTEVAIGRQGKLASLAVNLKYQEEVTGLLEWTEDPSRLPLATPKQSFLIKPIAKTFKTRGLVLRLPQSPADSNALPSLCQALRHVLPVHLGVEDDALEVVTLGGEDINGEEAHGIAIVDLYPGGIGLIDAIGDDTAWLLRLLEWTADWLEACDDLALQTPVALATNTDQAPDRKAALGLLRQLI